MGIIFNAVAPVFLLLVLGNLLRRRGLLSKDFWSASDILTYFILMPALLITKIAHVNLSTISLSEILIYASLYFLLASLGAYTVYRLTANRLDQLSSIYQATIRFNTYIVFAIVSAVWGNEALAATALLAGVFIPMVNVCCIVVFSLHSKHLSFRKISLSIIKNPLIISCFIGFIVNCFPVLMPTALFNSLSILAKAALPLALLSVGAAVQVKRLVKTHTGFTLCCLWVATLSRLLFIPLLAFMLGKIMAIDDKLLPILVVYAAVPTATSAYILAKQMGGDADLMTTLISLQTLMAIPTLIFWLNILH